MSIYLRKPICGCVFILCSISLALAGDTRTWEQSKYDDLIKGTTQGVAISSTGGLELAPAFKPLSTTPSTYIWAAAPDACDAAALNHATVKFPITKPAGSARVQRIVMFFE